MCEEKQKGKYMYHGAHGVGMGCCLDHLMSTITDSDNWASRLLQLSNIHKDIYIYIYINIM